MNIKIILIGLVLLFSGCVETVEVPTPIPTSNVLTEISNVSMNIVIRCYDTDAIENKYNNIHVNKRNNYIDNIQLSTGNTYTDVYETITIVKHDGYSVLEVYRMPEFDDAYLYLKNNSIYDNAESCMIYTVTINYKIFRAVNDKVVVDKMDSHDVYVPFSPFSCGQLENSMYEHRFSGYQFQSMHDCIDDIFYSEDIMGYKQYYPEILDKYR